MVAAVVLNRESGITYIHLLSEGLSQYPVYRENWARILKPRKAKYMKQFYRKAEYSKEFAWNVKKYQSYIYFLVQNFVPREILALSWYSCGCGECVVKFHIQNILWIIYATILGPKLWILFFFSSYSTMQYREIHEKGLAWIDSIYSVTSSWDDISRTLFANTPVLESVKRRANKLKSLGTRASLEDPTPKTVNFVDIWRVQYNTLITSWPLNDGQMSAWWFNST